MQDDSGATETSSEVQKTSGGDADGLVDDIKSTTTVSTNPDPAIGLNATSQTSNNLANSSSNNNHHQQQQLTKSSTNSPQQQQSSSTNQQTMPASTTEQASLGNQSMASNTNTTSSNANVQTQHQHHQQQHNQGGYHNNNPRHGGQHYNHQIQHYHHQQHNKYHNNQRGDNESNVNHILLITVINPHSTITCNVIHQICSPYGKVHRIVIFKKNGVQAMVEFDNVESAKRAKLMLHGCDMYSGCCTLRIEFAKPSRLNIHKNDNDSFDYTTPNLPIDGGHDSGGVGGGIDPNLDLNEHPHSQTGISGQQNSPHQSHSHHPGPRGGMSGGRVGGIGGSHHFPHHAQSSTHHHGQVHGHSPSLVESHQHGATNPSGVSGGVYGGPGMDQSAAAAGDSFHPDANNDIPQGYAVDSYLQGSHGNGPHGNLYSSRQDGHHHHHHHQHQHQHHRQHPRSANMGGGHNHSSSFSTANTSNTIMHANFGPPQGTVMMVYGLQPERTNCDRLFNLFCLYGNVARVKFLRTKEGCAMVQMGDVLAVDRCVSSLNKITLFGSELQISYSKQAFLHDVIQPFVLPDGTLSFRDLSGNKNNRFKNPDVAAKNRILPPSQVLHFFNAPLGITEDEIVHLFKQNSGYEPVSVKIFTPKGDNSKSSSGLVTFKDAADATEALVMCNHLNMPRPGAPNPYILRLCFSPPTYMRQPPPPPPSYPAPIN